MVEKWEIKVPKNECDCPFLERLLLLIAVFFAAVGIVRLFLPLK